jgi:hypothetical protein
MKKVLLWIVLALAAAASSYGAETCSKSNPSRPQGALPLCRAFDGATGDGSSAIIDTFGFRYMSLEAWATTTSTATINILCRDDPEAPFKQCAQDIINPDSTTDNPDHIRTLARAYQYQITISGYGGGAVFVSFVRQSY